MNKKLKAIGLSSALALAITLLSATSASASVNTWEFQMARSTSSGTKLCLTSHGAGAAVTFEACKGTSAQQWFGFKDSAGVSEWTTKAFYGSPIYSLTASSASSSGTFSMQKPTSASGQKWTWSSITAEVTTLDSVSNPKYVMAVGSLATGQRALVKPYDGGNLQQMNEQLYGTVG